jgi:transcriptional regulator with XRE-family HTH domain
MLATEWRRIAETIGQTVRQLRGVLGWSQQRLADEAVVSQGTISRLEAARPAIPFHSIVVVLQALAAGMSAVEVPVSPTVRALLSFATTLGGPGELRAPVDPEVLGLLRTFHRLLPAQQAAVLQLVRVAVALTDTPVAERA